MMTVVAFLVLLGVLITVHELGHFLVAKACGVRVLTFSIGFGPRLVGFQRGETEYRISVLPLGGYVRMYGDDITEEVPAVEQRRAFLYQPYLRKSAIAVAGPAANLLLPVALFFALTVGSEQVPAPVVGTVLAGQPAAEAGLRPGDRVLALDGNPIDRYEQFQAYVEPRPGVPIRLTVHRAGERLDVMVTPRTAPSPTVFDRERTVGRLGVVASPQLPIVVVQPGSPAAGAGVTDLDRVLAVDGRPITSRGEFEAALDAAADTVVLEVETRAATSATEGKAGPLRRQLTVSRATEAGTVTADGTASIDGAAAAVKRQRFGVTSEDLADESLALRVDETASITAREAQRAARRFGLAPADGRVAAVLPGTAAAERGFVVGMQRVVAIDGRPLLTSSDLETALRADPDGVHVLGFTAADGSPEVLAFRMLPAPERQMGGVKIFGVTLLDTFIDGEMVTRSVSPLEALQRSLHGTWELVLDVFRGFAMLFSGRVGIESLGGPITIAKMSGQAAELGIPTFVHLMGLISVNLAVINLMPIPVLDGGHLLIFTVERVIRRRLSLETRMKITKVGLAIVGLLMLVAIGNDVLGLF